MFIIGLKQRMSLILLVIETLYCGRLTGAIGSKGRSERRCKWHLSALGHHHKLLRLGVLLQLLFRCVIRIAYILYRALVK